MFVRLVASIVLALLMSSCAAPSDRYAFWRDDKGNTYPGTKPNLGDVPVAPNVANAKAEMETMRQRLEKDRDDAYLAAQSQSAPSQPVTMTSTSISDDVSHISDIQTSPLAAPQPLQQKTGGNVVYNYGTLSNTMPYTYGYSPVNIRSASSVMPTKPFVSGDPSVSVDWSALGGGGSGGDFTMASSGIRPLNFNGEPAVYFNYGSARLSPGDRNTLRSIANRISARPQSVVIIGHASKPTGAKNPIKAQEINLKMSAQRATAVLHQLATMGVRPDAINVTAYGDAMAKGVPAKDQRVDIQFNN